MKAVFLNSRQVIGGEKLDLFDVLGPQAKATDFTLATADDDGFLVDSEGNANYFLQGGKSVSRFGLVEQCSSSCVRPAMRLAPSDEKLLKSARLQDTLAVLEYGSYPARVIDAGLRESLLRDYEQGHVVKTGRTFHFGRLEPLPEFTYAGRRLCAVTLSAASSLGFLTLSDGESYATGSTVFLEVRPVTWYYDATSNLLLSKTCLIGGMDYERACAYLEKDFLGDLLPSRNSELSTGQTYSDFKCEPHDEIETIKAYVQADIPVFIHGLSGDGKSDRVKQIDPTAMDIELVNETPETINGKTIYNEARNEIREIKPVWLQSLEELCQDGKLHVLFFDELTNATKQTQSIIFKLILQRIVNNRWRLPENVRIVAAGNDRSESSVAHDLAEPLFGRFAHVYIKTTVENWMPWAIRHNINSYVLEFLATNSMYLRTEYTGQEANADPRRWEMASKILDSSGNDFALLEPAVGREITDVFIRFFQQKRLEFDLSSYTDEELAALNVARRYQVAQQCLGVSSEKLEDARKLVAKLGSEYLAWFDYTRARKAAAEKLSEK